VAIQTIIRESDIYTAIPIAASPEIHAFHQSQANERCLVGGVRSGKTIAELGELIIQDLRHPGNRSLVARWTFADLKKTTMETFWEMFPDEFRMEYNKQDGVLKWKPLNGKQNTTVFMGLDDKRKLKSLEIGQAMIDEVNEVDPEIYRFIEGRLSHPLGPRRLMCAANPEGKDPVIWAHYHPDGPDYSPTREYFQVDSMLNPYLPEDYKERLRNMPDNWQKRYVHGEFVVFEGLIYPSFSKDIHVVDPFVVDPAWNITRVIDFGMSNNPSVCLWIASDFMGNHFVVKEFTAKDTLIDEFCSGIHELSSGMNIHRTFCDPSMFKMDQPDKLKRGYIKVADVFFKENVRVYPANNDFRTRFDRTNTMLFVDPRKDNPLTGEIGSPSLFVFNTCSRTIDELESRQWSKKLGEEKPREGHDDHVDCVEYFCNTDPKATMKAVKVDPYAMAAEEVDWVTDY
jgi:hypothetical protein